MRKKRTLLFALALPLVIGAVLIAGAAAPQRRRSTWSFWLKKTRARAMGTTTITAPQKRLLRKLDREGVMEEASFRWMGS